MNAEIVATSKAPPKPESRMTWEEICALEFLQDAPFKVETDALGKIEMTPASNKHSRLQGAIERLLTKLDVVGGETMPECSVETGSGVKVADVVWFSEAYAALHGEKTCYSIAPEICIEILSPYNTMPELLAKGALYLGRGAKEVWICDGNGRMDFFDAAGSLRASKIFPDFPNSGKPGPR